MITPQRWGSLARERFHGLTITSINSTTFFEGIKLPKGYIPLLVTATSLLIKT